MARANYENPCRLLPRGEASPAARRTDEMKSGCGSLLQNRPKRILRGHEIEHSALEIFQPRTIWKTNRPTVQPIENPPSHTISCPQMFLAASETRKTAVSAMSSAVANLPSTCRLRNCSMSFVVCAGPSPVCVQNGVSTGPGAMQLTRIPCGANSTAIGRANAVRAALPAL